MARLVDGLLDVSRIARGKMALLTAPLDLQELVHRAVESRRGEVTARGLSLEVDAARTPLWLEGDETRLTQVLDNLIGNAIKFTTAPGTISVVLSRDDDTAVVRVRDTGRGIAPAQLSRVFEPFRQAGNGEAASQGGLGLGLALAKGIVELHRGAIAAHSAGPGRGTEVEMRLPLTAAPPDRASTRGQPTCERHRILIVEDNEDAAQMLHDLLEMAGHEVLVATTGPQAVELLRQREVDLVLSDLGLPDMTGYDLARTIRADDALPTISLVALSGYGQPGDRQRACDAGFDEHLTKPVDLDTLDAVLAQLAPTGSPGPGA